MRSVLNIRSLFSAAAVVVIVALCGCKSDPSGASAKQVGKYSAAPSTTVRPRVGITPFKVEGDLSTSDAGLGDAAADQMAVLLNKTGRFTVIERAAFANMIEQQGMTGMVRPGQFVRPGDIEGVDYVLIGSVSHLSVALKADSAGMWDQVTNFVTRSGANKQIMVTADCGVGFSFIDPQTGDSAITSNSELNRTASAADLGIDVLDRSPTAENGEISVSADDRITVLKLALDDGIRKAIAKIDRFLKSQQPTMNPTQSMAPGFSAPPTGSTVSPAPAPASAPAAMSHTAVAPATRAVESPTTAPTVATGVCPNCGTKNDPAARFCKKCGAKLR